MKIKKIFIILFIIFFVSMFSGCKKKTNYQAYTITYFDYFDTVTTIIGYEKEQKIFDENALYIESLLEEYHKLYDIYHTYSDMNNIYTINTSGGKEVKVDQRIIDLLKYAIEMYNKTNGMMNVAMGSVLKIWHDERELASYHPQLEGHLPSMTDLKEAAKHTNIHDIIIDEENKTVRLADSQMRLDVGAIAKGYTTEQIAKKLQEKGITSYLLNVGGNIRMIGAKADGSKWKVGIQNPDLESDNLAVLGLQDYTVVTSGSYQRYYYVDGKKYHHIIDPNTLMPEDYYTSVSVVTRNSGLADALSTALFNMSLEEGKNLIQQFNEVYVMWVDTDNKIYYSEGFNQFITQ